MNKKLIVLIVALECVFAVFLISIFGPMIKSYNSEVLVTDIYLLDEDGKRLVAEEGEEAAKVTIGLPSQISYTFTVVVETDEATNRDYTVTTNRPDETRIKHGKNNTFTVTFTSLEHSNVTITVTPKDGSQVSAVVYLTKAGGSNVVE